jgi:hypothetical protein
LLPAGDGGVFVLYEYALATGARDRKIEFITVRAAMMVETQVFFSGCARRGFEHRTVASSAYRRSGPRGDSNVARVGEDPGTGGDRPHTEPGPETTKTAR